MVQVVDCLFMCLKVGFKSGGVFPGGRVFFVVYIDEVQVEIFKCALTSISSSMISRTSTE